MMLSWPKSSMCWAWVEAWTLIWTWAWASSIMGLGLCHQSSSMLSILSWSWKDWRARWRRACKTVGVVPWLPLEALSPPPSCAMRSRGEETLGGCSLKDEARSSEPEGAGTATSTFLFLLKRRPEQVSSSSEAAASATPFCLWFTGAGVEGPGVEVAGPDASAEEGPRATLSWRATITNCLLFSALSTISAYKDNNT